MAKEQIQMGDDLPSRYRISAKQTAKGLWYFDATAELVAPEEAPGALLKMIQQTEKLFRDDGRQLIYTGTGKVVDEVEN